MRLGTVGAVPFVLGVGFAMVFLMGGTIGVSAVANGESVNVVAELEASMFEADGSIREADTSKPRTTVAAVDNRLAEIMPTSPAADQWLRQHLMAPLLKASIHVAAAGYGVGVAIASRIGVGAAKFLLNLGVVGILCATIYRVYRVFSEVAE